MTLLDLLGTELLGPKSVGEMSKTANATPEQTKQLVTAALPLLLAGMHQNSQTAAGAASLAKALGDHAPEAEKSTSSMLKKADTADGKKIVSHILGGNEKEITKGLAGSTGMSQTQVSSMLGQLAPVVLSLVGNYTQTEQQQAPAQAATPNLTSLLGTALLGGGYQQQSTSQQSGLNLMNLAGSLLGGSSSSSGASAGGALGGALLGSLLGGGLTQTTQTTAASTKPSSSAKKPSSSSAKKPASSAKKPASSTSKPAAEETTQSGGLNLSGLLMGLLK